MRFEHERPSPSEITPLLVPPTSSEEPQDDPQQDKSDFEWKKHVWVVSAIWSGVFLGALDGGHPLSGSRVFFSPRICLGTIVATLATPVRRVLRTLKLTQSPFVDLV